MKLTKSQEKAIVTRGKNILVSAGAGSGKTGVLKERVIQLLREGIHIDEMIILTFTNAAAFEMRKRIIDSIMKEESLLPELKRINRAIISTYDAFSLKLVKEYHYLLNVPSNITIGDQIQLLDLEQETLNGLLKEYYEKDDSEFNSLVLSLFQRGDDLLYQAVSDMAKKVSRMPNYMDVLDEYESRYFDAEFLSNQFDVLVEYLRKRINDVLYHFNKMKEEIDCLVNKDDRITPFLHAVTQVIAPFKAKMDSDRLLKQLLEVNLPSKPGFRNSIYSNVLENEFVPIQNAFKELKGIFQSIYSSNREEAIANVMKTKPMILKIVEIVKEYLKRLSWEKRNHNLFLFDDIMDMAIELLKKQPKIAMEYKNTIREIMIDEYQDTNDIQEYFISLIANDNLFLVGDMKQSIYGFRDANPLNFLARYNLYQTSDDGVAIDLRENFRSRKQVLNDINAMFDATMSESIGGINYKDNQSLIYGQLKYNRESEHQQYGIQMVTYDSEAEKDANISLDKTGMELERLVQDIQYRISMKEQIYDLDSEEFRDIRYSDMAILIDRSTEFERISSTLSKHSIPVNLYSDEPFVESPEMLFMISYLKLLRCFRDEAYLKDHFRTAFYSVARSFVFQLRDEDIIHFLLTVEIESLFDLTKMNQGVFTTLYESLADLVHHINFLPVSDLLKKIYGRLHLFEAISHLDNPGKKEEKLDYFVLNMEHIQDVQFDDLIRYLELIEENREWDIEYAQKPSDKDAVKLMTMHKSKGLQFPVVYIMGLGKRFNFQDNKEFFLFDRNFGILSHVIEEGYYPTFTRFLLLNEKKRNEISERIRLFYVALTRAQEHLVLFLDEKDIKENYNLADAEGYIDEVIRMKYMRYTDLISSTKLRTRKDTVPSSSLFKETHDYQPIMNTTIAIKPYAFDKKEVITSHFSKQSSELLSDETIEAMEYGTRIHQYLESFDYDDRSKNLTLLPANIRKNMQIFLESEVFDWNQKPRTISEYGFVWNVDSDRRQGKIDLLVQYENRIVIVDFKLKQLSDDAYVQQLQGYHDFVSSKTALPIECYLFAILTGEIKKIIG